MIKHNNIIRFTLIIHFWIKDSLHCVESVLEGICVEYVKPNTWIINCYILIETLLDSNILYIKYTNDLKSDSHVMWKMSNVIKLLYYVVI